MYTKPLMVDFIERSRANLKTLSKGPYEVTQLINSSLALLVIPKEKFYQSISDSMIDTNTFVMLCNNVTVNTYPETLDLKHIVLHIRNGIVHGRWDFFGRQHSSSLGSEIGGISICDRGNQGQQFKIKLSIDLLRTFFFEFSDSIIKVSKKKAGRI